jgi:hypothetical protein
MNASSFATATADTQHETLNPEKDSRAGAQLSWGTEIPLTLTLSPKGEASELEIERGLENMRFCETNRIGFGALFYVSYYICGSYGETLGKMNPVRLEQTSKSLRGGGGATREDSPCDGTTTPGVC